MKGDVITLSFNKKIAEQLQSKISSMGLPNARAATFHSEGLRNLTRVKGTPNCRIKVSNSKLYFLTEQYCTDKLEPARQFVQKLVGFAKDYAFGVAGQKSIDDTSAWMEIIQTQDISLDADVDFYDVIEVAKKVLIANNLNFREIDFGDMIYLPLLFNITCIKYDWVIVDEAQDTNVSRKLFLAKLLKDGGRLMAVGDANQAIYGFTGCESDSMNLIKDMFNCIELPLSICYRCGKNIVNEAKQYQPHIEAFEDNVDGNITSMKYYKFVEDALTLNLSSKDGIICRNNAPNVALAFALIRNGIGCRIEGKDIGQNLINLCNKWKRVYDLTEFTIKLTAFFEREFAKASKAKMQMLEDKLSTMVILIERCISLGKNDMDSLRSLITSMFTDNGDVHNADVVTLSSIHKAKGLEWDNVYCLGMEQLIPSKYSVTAEQLQQETNLKYIAVTRAMNNLVYVTDIPQRGGRSNEEE
jgi:superfamily I DNA/RNA helicase